MHDENPTPDAGGASISERLEKFLAADEPQAQEPAQPQEAQAPADEIPVDDLDEGAQESAQPQLSTSDFAKYLGLDEGAVDLAEDGSVLIKTKIDGTESTAKFADVLKTYQKQGHVDNELRKAAEQQKVLQQWRTQAEQEVQARVQQLETLANAAQQELTREFQSVDWNWLRENNPGEYAARLQDYQVRGNRLQQMFAQVGQQKQHATQQEAQQIQQRVAEESAKLSKAIPEWSDAAVASKESAELAQWALNIGIEPEVIQSLSNGKLASSAHIAALRKAMLYDKLQSSKPEIENKVRTAPKLVKAGTPQASREQQTIQNLKTTIRKSGGKAGIAEYLLATGKV